MSKHDQIVVAASGFLEPGETVELGLMAGVGRVSVKKQIATAAVTSILSLGMVTVTVRPVYRALALTNRRLLVLEATDMLGRPEKKLVGELPRELIQAVKRRSVLNPVYDLIDTQGSGQAVRIKCPWWNKDGGARLAAALSAPPATPPEPQ
jgi:hypothetical protein